MTYPMGRRCPMRPAGSPEELQRRRERAIALLKEGIAPVDVASRVGVDRRSVRRWKAAHRRAGATGIEARPAPGRPCALVAKHKRRLEQLLLKGARDCGFPTELWTCARVARVGGPPAGVGPRAGGPPFTRDRFGVHSLGERGGRGPPPKAVGTGARHA